MTTSTTRRRAYAALISSTLIAGVVLAPTTAGAKAESPQPEKPAVTQSPPAQDKPEPKSLAQSAGASSPAPLVAVKVWSTPANATISLGVGDWNADGKADLLVTAYDGNLYLLDERAKVRRVNPFSATPLLSNTNMLYGPVRGSGGLYLQFSDKQRSQVHIFKPDGKRHWTSHKRPEAQLTAAHWVDLDGDEVAELILGLDHHGGVEVVDSRGERRWSDGAKQHSVRCVTGIGKSGTQAGRVFCCTERGGVDVYDAQGKLLRHLLANQQDIIAIAAAPTPTGTLPENLLVLAERTKGDSDDVTRSLLCLTQEGQLQWRHQWETTREKTASPSLVACDLNGDRQTDWLITDSGSSITALDHAGHLLGTIMPHDLSFHSHAVLPRSGEPPLLITAGRHSLDAYALLPPDEAEAARMNRIARDQSAATTLPDSQRQELLRCLGWTYDDVPAYDDLEAFWQGERGCFPGVFSGTCDDAAGHDLVYIVRSSVESCDGAGEFGGRGIAAYFDEHSRKLRGIKTWKCRPTPNMIGGGSHCGYDEAYWPAPFETAHHKINEMFCGPEEPRILELR